MSKDLKKKTIKSTAKVHSNTQSSGVTRPAVGGVGKGAADPNSVQGGGATPRDEHPDYYYYPYQHPPYLVHQPPPSYPYFDVVGRNGGYPFPAGYPPNPYYPKVGYTSPASVHQTTHSTDDGDGDKKIDESDNENDTTSSQESPSNEKAATSSTSAGAPKEESPIKNQRNDTTSKQNDKCSKKRKQSSKTTTLAAKKSSIIVIDDEEDDSNQSSSKRSKVTNPRPARSKSKHSTPIHPSSLLPPHPVATMSYYPTSAPNNFLPVPIPISYRYPPTSPPHTENVTLPHYDSKIDDTNFDFSKLSKAQLVETCRKYAQQLSFYYNETKAAKDLSTANDEQHKQHNEEVASLKIRHERMLQPCIYSEFAKMDLRTLQKLYCAAGLPDLINDETLKGDNVSSSSSSASRTTKEASSTTNNSSTSDKSTSITMTTTIPTSKLDLVYRMTYHYRTSPYAFNEDTIGSEAYTDDKLKDECQKRVIQPKQTKEEMILAILQHDFKTNDSMFESLISQVEKNLKMKQNLEMSKELQHIVHGDASSGDATAFVGCSEETILSESHERFDQGFQKLLQHIQEQGHVKVNRGGKWSSLYKWCHAIRTNKRAMDAAANTTSASNNVDGSNGVPTLSSVPMCTNPLSLYQIYKLNSIGFSWGQKQVKKGFDEWFQLLTEFKILHGHCNVSASHDSKLSQWCKDMKKSYVWMKKLEENPNDEAVQAKVKKYYSLTPERIERLESIGFVWPGNPTNV